MLYAFYIMWNIIKRFSHFRNTVSLLKMIAKHTTLRRKSYKPSHKGGMKWDWQPDVQFPFSLSQGLLFRQFPHLASHDLLKYPSSQTENKNMNLDWSLLCVTNHFNTTNKTYNKTKYPTPNHLLIRDDVEQRICLSDFLRFYRYNSKYI